LKPYRYQISLRVRHPAMDPAGISAAFRLDPKRCWKAGDPRMTPVGTPLSGTWRESYWVTDVLDGDCPDKTLAVALSELAERFSPHRQFFQKIRAEGGRVEFFVGWYIDGNRGDIFDVTLLGRLADLGINLSLDIYPPINPADEY